MVTINGRDFYLGKHGSPESRAEYDRLLAEWLTGGRQLARATGGSRPLTEPTTGSRDLTVNELSLGYFKFAEGYYRKGGRPTGEVTNIKYALRPLLTCPRR